MKKTCALVVLLLAATGVAEEKKITLEFTDTPLGEAAKMVSEMAGTPVKVSEELVAVPVTLKVREMGLDALLKMLVQLAAADAECVKEADGSYLLRKKPAPVDWREEIGKQLEVSLNLDFEGTPIEEAFRFIAELVGVTVFVDPETIRSKTPDELNITLEADGITAKSAIELLVMMKGLASDLRYGVVFVASKDRLAKLPKDLLSPPAADASEAEKALRAKLAEIVSLDFEETSIAEGVKIVATLRELGFAFVEAAAKAAGSTTFSLEADGITAEQALALILLPNGFRGEVREGALVISRPE